MHVPAIEVAFWVVMAAVVIIIATRLQRKVHAQREVLDGILDESFERYSIRDRDDRAA